MVVCLFCLRRGDSCLLFVCDSVITSFLCDWCRFYLCLSSYSAKHFILDGDWFIRVQDQSWTNYSLDPTLMKNTHEKCVGSLFVGRANCWELMCRCWSFKQMKVGIFIWIEDHQKLRLMKDMWVVDLLRSFNHRSRLQWRGYCSHYLA